MKYYIQKIMQSLSTQRWVLLLCVLMTVSGVQASDFLNRLKALPGISQITSLESDYYPEKYEMFIDQALDPKNPAAGSFKQRVIVGHVGFDRPTVIVTEGYAAGYATNPRYREELTQLLNANLVFVEYRFFDKSTPSPCQWEYLTVENSMYDLHKVNTTFKEIYKNKWIATGISKGGQTTMCYRAFFPDDVDVSVPYVGPLSKGIVDGRHEPFIAKKVNNKEGREKVKAFQTEVLKRKVTMMPMFKNYCKKHKYQFRAPYEEIFDFVVLEYSFAFWQWGTPVENIPALENDNKTLFNHLMSISEPNYFAQGSPTMPFFVQAAKELGYYGYDIRPFKKYLSIKNGKDYLQRLMLPEELEGIEFDKTLYKKVRRFLKKNDLPMIFIYGGDDPWTATGVTWLKNKEEMKCYILPGGSHRTRIGSFDKTTREEIMQTLQTWLSR